MEKVVIGYFPDMLSCDAVFRELLDLGYPREDMKTLTEPAVGGGPAASGLRAPGSSIADGPTESILGAGQYTMRNAPIMLEVAVEGSRAERVADLFRARGARDVEARDASLAPVTEQSLAATGHSAAEKKPHEGKQTGQPPLGKPRKTVK